MARKLTEWNILVKKVFHEGKSKNKNYTFKQALKDASKLKGSTTTTRSKKQKMNKTKLGGDYLEETKTGEPSPEDQITITNADSNSMASSNNATGGKRRKNKTHKRHRR